MRYLLTTFTTIIATAIFVTASPVLAQTPDNETPANEGVCDEVFFSTPGLYGLCVAFCEAQDFAALDEPITEGDLDALASAAPSGRILATYNRKKSDADPDMPCILVEEPCPCWTAEEMANIDGLKPDGSVAGIFCSRRSDRTFIQEDPEASTGYGFAIVVAAGDFSEGFCTYFNGNDNPVIERFLNVSDATLNGEQALACQAEVDALWDAVCP